MIQLVRHIVLMVALRHVVNQRRARHSVSSTPGRHAVYTTAPGGAGPTPTPPTLTSVVISGTVRRGNTLACLATATGDPTITYSYDWRADGVSLGAPDQDTYTCTAADLSAEIDCEVTATNGAGSDTDASNVLTSPLRPWLLFDPDAWIWVRTEGYDVAIGGDAGEWEDVLADVDPWSQSVSSQQAELTAGGLAPDGTDDVYVNNAAATRAEGACTIFIGVTDLITSGTGERALFGFASNTSGGNTIQTRLSFARPDLGPNATRQRVLINDGTTTVAIPLTEAVTLGPPYHLALRMGAPGGNARAYYVGASSLAQLGSTTTRPAVAQTYQWGALYARPAGIGPSMALYSGLKNGYFAMGSFEYSDAQMLIANDCLIALGVK